MVRNDTMIEQPYGAYFRRNIPPEDIELTHTAPGTPCGEYLRRFWQPVALSAELKDLPVRVKIMHEDLVVFRDGGGAVGVLQLRCSHRGASLEFGRIRERGIRCCYHGWHYDVDGKILDMPGEPPESRLRETLCHGAYPAVEYKGLVWTYMGPPAKRPVLPRYDTLETDEFDHADAASKVVWPCNWLQIRDNSLDPLHTVGLHTISPEGTGFSQEMAVTGEIDFAETPIGMIYVYPRRIGDNIWIRMGEAIYPNAGQFGLNAENGRCEHPFNGPEAITWSVPIDDTHTVRFRIRHFRKWQARDLQAPKLSFGQQEGSRRYEEKQRLPTDYDAQVSQGPIVIHALEHLVEADKAIIKLRENIRKGIEAVKRDEDPPGVIRQAEVVSTYCSDTVVRFPPATTPEEDRNLLRTTGQQLAEKYLLHHPAPISCPPGWLEIEELSKNA